MPAAAQSRQRPQARVRACRAALPERTAARHTSLCPFNDGDRFCWTAQAQLISKVYLKKHLTLPRCYTLNAKDKKMVNDFWKVRARV